MNSDNSFNSSIEEDETDGNYIVYLRLQKHHIPFEGINVLVLFG